MIFAPRGVGKTWIALSVAHAVSSGGQNFGLARASSPPRALHRRRNARRDFAGAIRGRCRGIDDRREAGRTFGCWRPISRMMACPISLSLRSSGCTSREVKSTELIIVDNLSTVARGPSRERGRLVRPGSKLVAGPTGGGPFRSLDPPCRQGRRSARNVPQRGRAGYCHFVEPAARLFGD